MHQLLVLNTVKPRPYVHKLQLSDQQAYALQSKQNTVRFISQTLTNITHKWNIWAAQYNTWLLLKIDAQRHSLFFSFCFPHLERAKQSRASMPT